MNPVNHFEFPYHDALRICAFYQSVFGWQTKQLSTEMDSYILATTAVEDVTPGTPAGAINGGFFPVKPDWPDQHPSVVIGVSDIQETMRLVKQHGGEVLGDSPNSRLRSVRILSRYRRQSQQHHSTSDVRPDQIHLKKQVA